MNNEIIKIFYNRAKLIQNLDKIVLSSKKNNQNDGQLSLFQETNVNVEISLDEPEDFNALKMADAERNVLGFDMLYSRFDEYFSIKCKYANGNMALLLDDEMDHNITLLAEIKLIEYKTSQYGNKYAKLVFSDNTGEDKLYLFGKLYEKMIAKCFLDKIYLLTLKKSEKDSSKMDIVNFMLANDIDDACISSKNLYVTTTSNHLPQLRMYLKCFMMGDDQDVNIKLTDLNITMPSVCKCSVNNENLLEMSKNGFEIQLR